MRLLPLSLHLAAGLVSLASLTSAAEPDRRLPFIDNDYPGALAQARAQQRPLLVEAWAPW